MVLSAARPYFCPHPAYFARILESDVFVVLDDVQFPLGATWITRNRFKNDRGVFWMRVPVLRKGLGLQKIRMVRACEGMRWRRKILEGLKHAYRNAPYYEDNSRVFEDVLYSGAGSLLEIDMALIMHVSRALGMEARVIRMSETGVSARGGSIPVELCRELGASKFLAGPCYARSYEPAVLERHGVQVVCTRHQARVYPQLWGGFMPNLSAFDLLFNCGPRSVRYL